MTERVADVGALGLDLDQLRERHRIEKDKRLRPEGVEQYVAADAVGPAFATDHYASIVPREPLADEVDAVIVGGGFGGLLAGARLVEAGLDRVRIIEDGADFGGVWYWNRYPGAACDTESYIYMPLLEEVGYMPTEKYAKAPEIQAHARRIAEGYGLYEQACLQTRVEELRWNDQEQLWIVKTDRGDRIRARYVVSTNAVLSRPKLPGVPGLRSFEGKAFHTSRWDYEYTGGSPRGDLTKLRDKRVAGCCQTKNCRGWRAVLDGVNGQGEEAGLAG